jgi:putative transposase
VPRILRSQLPDGFFHITARGVDGTPIVRDDDDRLAFLAYLAKTVERYGWNVYSFCLMTNHYHAVVETTREKLSTGVQYLSGRHAQRFNLRHGRRGHLFGERFASWVVATEEHFENARAYVRLNPVEAGLCVDPDEYRWSGDRDLERPFGR